MNVEISEEVVLVPLSTTDASEIFLLIETEREMLGKYLYWVCDVVDIDSTRAYLNSRISSDARGSSWYKVTYHGKAIGIFGIKSINPKEFVAEIGYWLSSQHQGKGIISRIISTMSERLKNTQEVRYIEIQCLAENRASISVAERAGGQHTKTIPDYFTLDGMLQDLQIYTVKL